MSTILKNFRLEPNMVRTLFELKRVLNKVHEKDTLVNLITTQARVLGVMYQPCPHMRDLYRDKKSGDWMVNCAKKGTVKFQTCLACALWQPTTEFKDEFAQRPGGETNADT